MTQYPSRRVVKVVEGNDFELKRKAPHGNIYRHPDGRHTTIPRSPKKIGTGLLYAISKQTGKDPAEFRQA